MRVRALTHPRPAAVRHPGRAARRRWSERTSRGYESFDARSPGRTDTPLSHDVPHYLLASHDGYGLGHARRSSLLASALLDADPASRVTLVTGPPFSPSWLG